MRFRHERPVVSVAPGVAGKRVAHPLNIYFLPCSSRSDAFRLCRIQLQMIQEALFFESIYEAMKSVVVRAGGNKAVGCRLRPTKTPEAAGRWLADCLNPARDERLEPEDFIALLRMGRELGHHAAMQYLATESGYQAIPLEPEDEKARLQREFVEGVKALGQLAAKLDRIGAPHLTKVA